MYVTLNELVLLHGTVEIAQLMDDEDGNISAPLLTAALAGDVSQYSNDEQAAISRAVQRAEQIIAQQMAFIDSQIGKQYAVPLDDKTARATPVQIACTAFVRAALGDDGDNISEQVSKERDYWRSWCRDIANGKTILPGVTAISAGSASGTEQRRLTAQPSSDIDWGSY